MNVTEFKATSSSINPKFQDKGFIIVKYDDLIPRIIPTPKGYCGFESSGHLLYVLALDIIYKFQCEDFVTEEFDQVRKFTRAYYQKNILQTNPWWPKMERKLLDRNSAGFNVLFKHTLATSLHSFYGDCAQKLVQECLRELAKIDLVIEDRE